MNKNLNISQEEFELIENYLLGNLESSEQQTIEQRIQEESTFKNSVEELRTLILGLESESLKSSMNTFHDEMDKNENEAPKKALIPIKWYQLMAAALIVIAAGSFWLTEDRNDVLFDKYFTPDPGLPTTMSTTDNYEFYKGMVTYKQGNYKEAIEQWEKLLVSETKNDTLNYFLGAANLARNNEAAAIDYLNKVLANDQFAFGEEATFYLGLAYLKAKDKETAIKYFKQSDNKKSSLILKEIEN